MRVDDEHRLTGWHLLAFLGELVLWGCAARLGWTVGTGGLRWVSATAALVAIVGVWSIWAAPRARRRLALRPRLVLIAVLGVLVAVGFVVAGRVPEVVLTLVSTCTVVLAQSRDSATRSDHPGQSP